MRKTLIKETDKLEMCNGSANLNFPSPTLFILVFKNNFILTMAAWQKAQRLEGGVVAKKKISKVKKTVAHIQTLITCSNKRHAV